MQICTLTAGFVCMINTYHIHIMGQVQGVGFRPFVYRMAGDVGINGKVYNSIDGVHIIFNAIETEAEKFYQSVISNAPPISHITGSVINKTANQSFTEFKIINSDYNGRYQVLLTPDFALCGDCHDELKKESGRDRRSGYPFITCTNCGPRYSIIERLPYDRENTSMAQFEMCPSCSDEYSEPTDRRYHSQTNSCSACGIKLIPYPDEKELPESEQNKIIEVAAHLLEDGKIIAVKGIGGYLLFCDATNKECIARLRNYKQRPSKPFALMYPDVAMVKNDVWLSPAEEQMLLSASAPVVLLQLKENFSSQISIPAIAPGLCQVGVMLPYAPLYQLLLSVYNKPVIATSANISSSPIVYEDIGAKEQLHQMADYVIGHNRAIIIPQDDSVIKFSSLESQKIVLRRSRGMAPTFINPGLSIPTENILATGALLKSTFTLTHQSNIYISQYLGDLDNYGVQENYKHCLSHFNRLLNTNPKVILTDKHPDYYSTSYGLELSKELNVPVRHYQHHKAHFAAVLGENNLLSSTTSILGVIWDGVGLGDDGQAWGGEFFTYKNYEFKRCNHFSYFDYLLADKMAREPRIAALAATAGLEGAEALLKMKFSGTEWINYERLLQKKGNLKTSSAGRLFDAVASLLGLSDVCSYEGEAAMYLENLALSYFRNQGPTISTSYFTWESDAREISLSKMLARLIVDIQKGEDKGFIAAKFHYSLACVVKHIATKQNVQNIALGGGVFQNALLVDLVKKQMTSGQNLFIHRQLSPNDECISFGQLCCYIIEEQRTNNSFTKNKDHVLSHSG